MRKIESEPSILWTVEFGEDSLQLSRLALWAGGPERAWYAAKHALAAFAWKGLDDNEDVVVQADAIAQKAESSIPDLRLEDLKAEFADHLTLWDPSRRLDKNVALLDEYDKRKLGKMIRRTIASVDLHGRWP